MHQMWVGKMAVFAYIVGDQAGGEGLVIDPAGDVNRLIKIASDNKIRIKYIVNTHGHVDHMTGNAEMKGKTGAEIIVHKNDAELVMFIPALIFRMHGAEKSPHKDIIVNDGDKIRVGEISLSHPYAQTYAGRHIPLNRRICIYRVIHCLLNLWGVPLSRVDHGRLCVIR